MLTWQVQRWATKYSVYKCFIKILIYQIFMFAFFTSYWVNIPQIITFRHFKSKSHPRLLIIFVKLKKKIKILCAKKWGFYNLMTGKKVKTDRTLIV